MYLQMARPRYRFQVFKIIVQSVFVLVVDDLSGWKRAILCLPNNYRTQLPNIWFGDFHPGATNSAAFMPGSDGHCSDR